MQMILMCAYENATTALSATRILGEEVPDRRYETVNHKMVLSGWPDVVLYHDAEELLKNPVFRMPTPAEQEQMAQSEQASKQVQESSELSGTQQGEAPDAQNSTPDTEPPAKQKKVSGG